MRSSKFETKEVGLLLCLDMYLEAANYKEEIVVRKLGFVYNELGSYNLNLINLGMSKRLIFQLFRLFSFLKFPKFIPTFKLVFR